MKIPADFYFGMNYVFYQVIPHMFPTYVEDSIVFSISTKIPPISILFSDLRGDGETPHREGEGRGQINR